VKIDYDISPKDQIRGAYISNEFNSDRHHSDIAGVLLTNPANNEPVGHDQRIPHVQLVLEQ